MAINEAMCYPPNSYYIDFVPPKEDHSHKHEDEDAPCGGPSIKHTHPKFHRNFAVAGKNACSDATNPFGPGHPTGENCGSVFWTKFNQRYLYLYMSKNVEEKILGSTDCSQRKRSM